MAKTPKQNDMAARGTDRAELGTGRAAPSTWRSVERSGIVRSEPLPSHTARAVRTQRDYAFALARWEEEGGAAGE